MVAKNITYMISQPKVTKKNPTFIGIGGPYNVTMTNLEMTGYFITSEELGLSIGLVITPTCLPDDGLLQTFTVDGIKHGSYMRDGSSDVFHKDRHLFNAFSGQVPHFRNYKVIFANTELKNFYLDTQYAYFNIYGSQLDSIEIRNFHVSEGTFSHEL